MRALVDRRKKQAMWRHVFQGAVWFWIHDPQLPNGWYAGVRDDSQHFEPVRTTSYQIFAAPAAQVDEEAAAAQVDGTESYSDFETAKREALNFAMAQPDVKPRRQRREKSPQPGAAVPHELRDPSDEFEP